MSKKIALIYGFLFLGVVVSGYLPILSTPGENEGSRILLKLFDISLMDNIMHGVTGVLFILASFLGTKYSKIILMTFGGYYFFDALFFLLMAPFDATPMIINILVNLPHAIISISIFTLLYKYCSDTKEVI